MGMRRTLARHLLSQLGGQQHQMVVVHPNEVARAQRRADGGGEGFVGRDVRSPHPRDDRAVTALAAGVPIRELIVQ